MNKNSKSSFSPSHDYWEEDKQSLPEWYTEYQRHLEKYTATSQQSIYEQISAIVGNNKPKFSSVEEAVADLKERTGLSHFIARKAQVQQTIVEPKIFKQIPEMKIFIDNFIDDRPGTSIESVIHDLLKLDTVRHRLSDQTDVDDEVKNYINRKLAEAKKLNTDFNEVNMNVGRVEPSSEIDTNVPLEFCTPQGS